MKSVFLVAGALLAALVAAELTGWIEFRDRGREALAEGNAHYAAGNYPQALEAYRAGLEHRANDRALNYNAGQAAFYTGEYERAVDYFGKAAERPNAYLQSGNASLAMGDAAGDAAQQVPLYQQALQTYKEGILAFPEDLALKYNYEYVKQKLESLQQEQEQQQQQEQQQDQQENSQNDDGSSDDAGENGEQDGEQEQQQDNEGQQQQEGQQEEEEQQGAGQDGDDQQDQGGAASDGSSASDPGREELEQIMEMLERQEEDSLKGNQEIREQDAGDAYDW